jgi:hypothetical protein
MTESGSLPLRNDVKPKSTNPNPHTPSRSRRDAPELYIYLPPHGGRGECRAPAAPAASCAIVVIERTRVTTSTPESPDIPARNGFTAYVVLLGDRAVLPPSSADMFCLSPVGPTQLRELDASVGASGPHDFAVRCNISRPRAVDHSRIQRTRPAIHRTLNAAASTASRPNVRDDHDTPLSRAGMARVIKVIWGA